MSDLEYTIRKMVERRGKVLTNIESVAFNVRLAFGLADLTFLLPVVANTFYFAKLFQSTIVSQVTESILLRFATNSGQGSVGNVDVMTYPTANAYLLDAFRGECDSLQYIVNGNTAGVVTIQGIVFKITHTA